MKLILSLFFFASIAAAQPDVKLPFTPKPRLPMFELSHKSAQKVGFRRADSLCIKQTMPAKVGFVYFGLDTLQPPTEAEVMKRLLSHPSVNVFLQLYSRYEKEAMKDSLWGVLREYDDYVVDAKTRRGRLEHVAKYGWVHPNAPPPNPFIEWLRRNK